MRHASSFPPFLSTLSMSWIKVYIFPYCIRPMAWKEGNRLTWIIWHLIIHNNDITITALEADNGLVAACSWLHIPTSWMEISTGTFQWRYRTGGTRGSDDHKLIIFHRLFWVFVSKVNVNQGFELWCIVMSYYAIIVLPQSNCSV